MSLTTAEKKILFEIFESISGLNTVWVYGSRVRNSHKKFSDVDLVIDCIPRLNIKYRLASSLDDSVFPYKVDIVTLDDLRGDFGKEVETTKVLLWRKTQDL